MLKESKADIFVDPVLHTACALDIKHHCAAIPPGRGRRKCWCFVYMISLLYDYLKFGSNLEKSEVLLNNRCYCQFFVAA